MKKTLKQRVEDLEKAVYAGLKISPEVETCPRCGDMTLNAWQKGICKACAYATPERLSKT